MLRMTVVLMVAQVHKVEFDRGTNARDLQEQLAVVAGYNRLGWVILKAFWTDELREGRRC